MQTQQTTDTQRAIAARLNRLRTLAGISQEDLAAAAGMTQPTYSRTEEGARPLKGDEAVQLADALGIRVGALLTVPAIQHRAKCAARTSGAPAAMTAMRDRLSAYLELDAYLDAQGIPAA